VSETSDLVAALLEANADGREQLLRAAEPAALEAALAQLGHRREAAAAEILGLVELVVDDRALRKTARRELHRLRSMGVETPQPSRAPDAPSAVRGEAHLAVSEAWATDIDPTGARALWLIGERPLGGIWFAALLINDLLGVQDISLVDTTRKRFQREFDQAKRGLGAWVSLPGEYALRLVREAVDLTHERDAGLPARYRAFRDVFGEAPGPPERALVYDTISTVELNFNPAWLDESARLLGEPEVAGWFVPVPSELQTRALDVARGSTSGILVPGHTPTEEVLHLLSDAAQQGLTPVVRRALRRRLEETAYVFLSSDRLSAARSAAAAARALDESGPFVSPERQPFLHLLLLAGVSRLMGSETVGGRRASDVLLELLERATQQRENQGGAVETRPSGLILPR
jgi:hypothetical protein